MQSEIRYAICFPPRNRNQSAVLRSSSSSSTNPGCRRQLLGKRRIPSRSLCLSEVRLLALATARVGTLRRSYQMLGYQRTRKFRISALPILRWKSSAPLAANRGVPSFRRLPAPHIRNHQMSFCSLPPSGESRTEASLHTLSRTQTPLSFSLDKVHHFLRTPAARNDCSIY